MTDSPALKLVGAVLNTRWRLTRLLGEGGMGAVFEAEGTRGEGKRAVKLLHEEFIKEGQILQRFFAEAQATKLLHHPNVAQVYDSATAENGTPYLVMELLQGMPLSSYLDAYHAVPPPQAVPIIYGVLQALGVAHAHRIVHRDIKPDNVFLVRDQSGALNAKVLDFGIAKVMDLVGGMGQKTRTGVLLGTPGYMSPEQIKNSKAVDARSDLWSVGILFYELITGGTPFPADNEFTRLTAVLSEEMMPLEQVNPALTAWTPFFRRALAKDPTQRFQSADEMAMALMSVARGNTMRPPAPATATAMGAGPPMPRPPQQSVPPMASGAPMSMQATGVPMSPHGPPASPMTGQVPYSMPQPGGQVHTHVSAQRPVGTPTMQEATPSVAIVAAPPIQSKGAPWWLVAVVGLLGIGVGFVIGFLVKR